MKSSHDMIDYNQCQFILVFNEQQVLGEVFLRCASSKIMIIRLDDAFQ